MMSTAYLVVCRARALLLNCRIVLNLTSSAAAEGARNLRSGGMPTGPRRSFEGRISKKIVSYWSDDAHVLQPGLPPIDGQDPRFAPFVTAQFLKIPGFKIQWGLAESRVFARTEKMAYMLSTVGRQPHPAANSGALEFHARRSCDGVWRRERGRRNGAGVGRVFPRTHRRA